MFNGEDRTKRCSATMTRSDSDCPCRTGFICRNIHPITLSHDGHHENRSIAIISPAGTNNGRWRVEREASESQSGTGRACNRCHQMSKGMAARGKASWSKEGEWKRIHCHPCFKMYSIFVLHRMCLVHGTSNLLPWP